LFLFVLVPFSTAVSQRVCSIQVLIETDENGEVVRERMKDTDAINLYKSMRECLIYLTHLDPQDTMDIMEMKLGKQV
jgi:exportin-1